MLGEAGPQIVPWEADDVPCGLNLAVLRAGELASARIARLR